MRHDHRGQSGFTLIELLTAIAIVGIAAAVVVFAVSGDGVHHPADPNTVYRPPTDRQRADRCFADGGSSWSRTTGCVWENPERRAPTSTTTSTTEYDPYGG